MKKLLSVTSIVLLSFVLLSGCSQEGTPTNNTKNNTQKTTATATSSLKGEESAITTTRSTGAIQTTTASVSYSLDNIQLKTDLSKYYVSETELDLVRCAEDMGFEWREELGSDRGCIFALSYGSQVKEKDAQCIVSTADEFNIICISYAYELRPGITWRYELTARPDFNSQPKSISITGRNILANSDKIMLVVHALEQAVENPYSNLFEDIIECDEVGGDRVYNSILKELGLE